MNPKLTEHVRSRIFEMASNGLSGRAIARELGVDSTTVSKYIRRTGETVPDFPPPPPCDQPSKKTGTFDWREACAHAKQMQALKKKMSWSQGDGTDIVLGNGKEPVILATFGDQHIGSYGADYELFEKLTDEIKDTPGLYVALLGDEVEFAIRLRSVLEITSQVLTPDMQEAFLEGWLAEIEHKVAFALWSNHAVMRQEQQGGTSAVKNILARRVHYFNGIGHCDLKVGAQVYKTAASHKFRGGSMFNRMHAQGRYVRQQASDRELVMQGDIHQWGYAHTEDGGEEKVYITGGTLHTNSGYAKRFFSLRTAPNFPCVVLHPDRHEMVPFKSIGNALKYLGR